MRWPKSALSGESAQELFQRTRRHFSQCERARRASHAIGPPSPRLRRGLAEAQCAEAEARRRGHARLRLYTNVLMTENLALYGRLGFQETAGVSEKGYERVYMAKELPP